MRKRERELLAQIRSLNDKLTEYLAKNCLSIEEAKTRDYIVRNQYIGKLKDKKITEDFKMEIKEKCGDGFDSITNKILNYEFWDKGRNILSIFRETLRTYEYKQIVLDTYGVKKNEK